MASSVDGLRESIPVAILGFGSMGRAHFRCFEKNPQCFVSQIYVRDPMKYQLAFPELRELFTSDLRRCISEQIDAIDICLPTFLHEETIQVCIESRKHVFVEKPLARTNAEAKRIAVAAEHSDRVFLLGHVLRFWPEYRAAKAIVDEGRLGRPLSLSTVRRQGLPGWSSDGWITNPNQSGGGAVDLQIHDLDFARWLFGEPLGLISTGHRHRTGSWEHVSTLLSFPGDVHANIQVSNLMPEGYPFRAGYQLCCEDGVLEYDSRADQTLTIDQGGIAPEVVPVGEHDPYQVEIDHFLECILEKKQSDITSIDDGARSLRLALASLDSLESGSEHALSLTQQQLEA